jgi:hypothetical protein
MKVPAPHNEKQSNTIAIFVSKLMGQFQAYPRVSISSLRQAPEVSKAINARAVSIRPVRLQRVAAHPIEADKLKTFFGVIDSWPRDVAYHIRFATARRTRTGAAEKLQSEVRLRLVVPRERQFIADQLRVS